MTGRFRTTVTGACCVALALAGAATAQRVAFADPAGDDFGPGTYVYPTDSVYGPGSFDLLSASLEITGGQGRVEVTLAAPLVDAWRTGKGFALQMVFVFVDIDHREGSGFTEGLRGLNLSFAPADAWDRVIVLSPQPTARLRAEIESKAEAMKDAVVLPARVEGAVHSIVAVFDAAALGGGDPASWGYQVVVQSNNQFPESDELLTRRVNDYAGQHRFGGGNDGMCDPQVIDLLAGAAAGGVDEIDAQQAMLKYECAPDGAVRVPAVLRMIRR
jgi:carbohydrate-binding DOMON domain-containing protein